tara:strand:- start:11 stop:301 length:291 start_codon:yes stop_codon:yes gene_type:complete
MSTTIIEKNNPKRWVIVQNNQSGTESFKCFGNIGPFNFTELTTDQPIVNSYMTEDELETEVNSIAGDSNYYKNAIEDSSVLFMGESNKYIPNLLKA